MSCEQVKFPDVQQIDSSHDIDQLMKKISLLLSFSNTHQQQQQQLLLRLQQDFLDRYSQRQFDAKDNVEFCNGQFSSSLPISASSINVGSNHPAMAFNPRLSSVADDSDTSTSSSPTERDFVAYGQSTVCGGWTRNCTSVVGDSSLSAGFGHPCDSAFQHDRSSLSNEDKLAAIVQLASRLNDSEIRALVDFVSLRNSTPAA
jgi:hypothetical protein